MPTSSPARLKSPKNKEIKVVTTVRFDRGLKRRAEAYARHHHLDFSVLLHVSLENTLKNGLSTEPEWQISEAFAKELLEQDARIARGEEKIYGPYTTKAETRAFLDSLG